MKKETKEEVKQEGAVFVFCEWMELSGRKYMEAEDKFIRFVKTKIKTKQNKTKQNKTKQKKKKIHEINVKNKQRGTIILSFALKMSLRRTWCARIFGCGFFLLLLNKGRIKGA